MTDVILHLMKAAISVPDEVFEEVDVAAKRLGISRSEVFTRAVREFLMRARGVEITASYDAAFGQGEQGSKDGFRQAATRKALLDVEWEEA
jgi:predicted transcriptional regulator